MGFKVASCAHGLNDAKFYEWFRPPPRCFKRQVDSHGKGADYDLGLVSCTDGGSKSVVPLCR